MAAKKKKKRSALLEKLHSQEREIASYNPALSNESFFQD